MLAAACSSATSGHAPGVAGGETPIAGLTTYPLAYVKRPVPTADIDARDLITSTAGGDLYVRDQASAGGIETNVTKSITQGMGDVKDLDVSMDGKKLVFALRLPLIKNATAAQQPTWKIYQYDALAKTVTQLTNDNGAYGAGHDIGPHYLRDGRIVFASTRQLTTKGILLDENRPQYPAQTDVAADTQGNKQPIFQLHVMNADGSNIHQISFNTNHDFAPSVLRDGDIVFSRWEVVHGTSQISLYHTNPDGTGLELYYGANSHATGAHANGDGSISDTNTIQFLNARQRSDGTLVAIVRPFTGTQQGGDIVSIDAEHYVEYNQATLAGAGAPGPSQASATVLGATTDANKPSPGGRFASVYPLYDGTNRLLVSWSPCLVQNTAVSPATSAVCTSNSVGNNVQIAPPQYTLWVYDPATSTLSPVIGAQAGLMIVDPVILQARTPLPGNIMDAQPAGAAQTLADQGLGLLIIRSVYDFDGHDKAVPDIAAVADPKQTTADQRPYRFVRIFKPVEFPDMTVRNIALGSYLPPGILGMREILEYAPVQPDGSIQIQVPANVPFTVDVLDNNARRAVNLPLHSSWMQVMPGETRTCNGCHTANVPGSTTPSHGRNGLTASVNPYYLDTVGVPVKYPDTLAALSPREAGETMATTLSRISCQTAANCSEVPSPNVVYSDIWTDPAASGRGPFAAFSYLYSDLMTTAPVNANCLPAWSGLCRVNIDYPLHIQPLWTLPRQTLAGGVITADHTCVLCHSPKDAAGAAQFPPDNLDLTGGASNDDANVSTSYRQLLFPRNQQQLTMGQLQNVMVPAPGPVDPVTGQPTTILVPAPQLAPPMVAGSAAASSTFLRIFDGSYQDPVLDHTGFLSPAELRLISEWLDIGAQYYNDPFVAPAI